MADADLTITKLGPIGDGIAQTSKETIYVERAIPGDRVRVHLRKDQEGITRGEITEILEASSQRQEAPCPHYDQCGSCTLQHLKEDYYRTWKQSVVEEALKKQKVQPENKLPPIFLQGGNRRRLTFSVFRKNNQVTVGYYRRRSNVIVDLDSCGVADPVLFGLREKLKPLLPSLLQNGKTIDIFLQRVGNNVDMVISGYVGKRGEPDDAILRALEQLMVFSPVVRVSWRPPESEGVKELLCTEDIRADFGGLKVSLPPAAFLQPTVEGERALVNAVLAALTEKGKFADLFSGCGTFTGPMLKKGSVDAFEFAQNAVAATTKAGQGKALKVTRRDLFRNPLKAEELNQYDAIVFDPPRAGCEEQATEMAKSRVPTLISVSCNAATFARDSRILCDGGYKLQSLQVIDQFQWSHHVEMVGVFNRT